MALKLSSRYDKRQDVASKKESELKNSKRSSVTNVKQQSHADYVLYGFVFFGFTFLMSITVFTLVRYRNKVFDNDSNKTKSLTSNVTTTNLRIFANNYKQITNPPNISSCKFPTFKFECGIQKFTPKTSSCEERSRIIGGDAAEPHSWPWQITLYEGRHLKCGGTLITDRYILTAAHCLKGRLSNYRIKMGIAIDSYYENIDDVEHKPVLFIKHGLFHYGSLNNDIALLKLETPINFTDKILPICLPLSHEDLYAYGDCYVTGWGTISPLNNFPSRQLMQLCVPMADQDNCKRIYQKSGGLTENMFCAGYKMEGKDACKGDSGGPFVCQYKNVSSKSVYTLNDTADEYKWYLVGITSWGIGCALPNHPGVYTKVSNFICWIANIITQPHYHNMTGTIFI